MTIQQQVQQIHRKLFIVTQAQVNRAQVTPIQVLQIRAKKVPTVLIQVTLLLMKIDKRKEASLASAAGFLRYPNQEQHLSVVQCEFKTKDRQAFQYQ